MRVAVLHAIDTDETPLESIVLSVVLLPRGDDEGDATDLQVAASGGLSEEQWRKGGYQITYMDADPLRQDTLASVQ